MSVARFSSTSSGSMRSRNNRRGATGGGRRRCTSVEMAVRARARLMLVALALLLPVARRPTPVAAQRPDSAAFYKALDLETSGKYKEAVPLFRAALHSSAGTSALLGLERVYAELGWADSLLAPLDTLIADNP